MGDDDEEYTAGDVDVFAGDDEENDVAAAVEEVSL